MMVCTWCSRFMRAITVSNMAVALSTVALSTIALSTIALSTMAKTFSTVVIPLGGR